MLLALLPSHCAWSFGWIDNMSQGDWMGEEDSGGFCVSCLLTWLSLISRNSISLLYFHCLWLYLPFSWRGRKGAQFQRRNDIREKAGSWTPTHPTADAVLLQQEARTQVCCRAPLATLSSCCQLSTVLVFFSNVSTLKITNLSTAELWIK